MIVSIIVRTYNEERYLDDLLSAVNRQVCSGFEFEIVIVDSGSNDTTLEIAQRHKCRITHIRKDEFTYGRSLNVGCEFASGDILVFLSGHCIPTSDSWLLELCGPLMDGSVSYSYGRQVGKYTTKYSETRHFEKWFPAYSKLPQEGFFCNNANAALLRSSWELHKFDETLTGLEDMFLAKKLVHEGRAIGYVSTAPVYHIHNESWKQVRIRYEREAVALHRIMPEVHVSILDFARFFMTGVFSDSVAAARERLFFKKICEIVLFRFSHYWGSYRGSHVVRVLSTKRKNEYFYPKDLEKDKYKLADVSCNKAVAGHKRT